MNSVNRKLFETIEEQIPLVDKWKPSENDRIFKTCKGAVVLPVSKFYGIDDNPSLDTFILASKRCYNMNTMLAHLPLYMNYFERYFDSDKELLINLFRIKYLIDYEESYDQESFINDIKKYFMSDSMIRKTLYMNEYNYMLDLDSKNYHNDRNPSLLYTDRHAKILMWMSIMINAMIPILTHFAYMKNILDCNSFLLKVYDILLCFVGQEFGVNIFGKLHETAASTVGRNFKDNRVLWDMQSIRGESTTTHATNTVNNILLNIIPKYTYDKNLVFLNYSSIRSSTGFLIDTEYEYNYVPLSGSKREGDQSDWDKFDSLQSKRNESISILNEANSRSTMNVIDYIYGPFDEQEVEFYKRRLINDDGEIINGFQKNLIFNLFYKYFGVPSSAYHISKDDYVILLLAAKRMLLRNNMVILPYVISSKVERVQVRKSINKKEFARIESSPYYEQIKNKYKNPKIEKYIMSLIATILTSDFRIIDFEDEEIDGKKIVNIPDIISEEIMMYVDMI